MLDAHGPDAGVCPCLRKTTMTLIRMEERRIRRGSGPTMPSENNGIEASEGPRND